MFRFWLIAGALNMLLTLIIAAAVGHNLQGEFVPVARAILDTAREIHFIHALGLIAVGIVTAQFGRSHFIDIAGYSFLGGIVLFCGGLYAAFGATDWFVKILIPIGGLTLMFGWIMFAAGALFFRQR